MVTGRMIRDKWMVAMQNLFELARKLDLYRASTNVAIGLLKDFSSALKKQSSASPQADAAMDAVQWLYEETSLVNHRLPIPDPVWEALKAGTSPHLLHIRRERLQDLLNRLVSVIRDRNERRRSRKIGAHGQRMQARAPGKPSGFSLPLGSGPDAQECRMSGAPCPSGPPIQLCVSWEDVNPSDSSNWDYLAVTRNNRAPHTSRGSGGGRRRSRSMGRGLGGSGDAGSPISSRSPPLLPSGGLDTKSPLTEEKERPLASSFS